MCINVKKAGQKISLKKTITNRLSSSDGEQISYKSKFTLVRVETPKNPWINPDKSPAKIFIIFSHCPCNAVQFTSVQKYQNIRIVPERESSQTANWVCALQGPGCSRDIFPSGTDGSVIGTVCSSGLNNQDFCLTFFVIWCCADVFYACHAFRGRFRG